MCAQFTCSLSEIAFTSDPQYCHIWSLFWVERYINGSIALQQSSQTSCYARNSLRWFWVTKMFVAAKLILIFFSTAITALFANQIKSLVGLYRKQQNNITLIITVENIVRWKKQFSLLTKAHVYLPQRQLVSLLYLRTNRYNL